MVPGGSKAKRLSLVNHTTKTIIITSVYFDLTILERVMNSLLKNSLNRQGFQGKLKFKSDKWVATL